MDRVHFCLEKVQEVGAEVWGTRRLDDTEKAQ